MARPLIVFTVLIAAVGQLQCDDLVPLQETTELAVVEGLSWLTYPITKEQFISTYFEQWPFHVRRPASFHHELGSFEAMAQLLDTQRVAHTDDLLMHPSKKFSQANCEWVKNGMRDLQEEYEDVYSAYLDGATIVCHLVAAYWPPLAALMQKLQQSTGFAYMANLYLSPRGAQGFTAHSDNKDGFIVQVAGSKRWVVHEGTLSLPLREHRVGRQWEPTAEQASKRLVFNGSLEAGDVFLVPRGFIHHAESSLDAASVHFTISAVQNLEWATVLLDFISHFPKRAVSPVAADFFHNALASAINAESAETNNTFLRRSLPFDYQAAASRSKVVEQFDTVVNELHATIRRQLVDVPSDMLASFEASFQLLLSSQERTSVLDAVLRANSIKLDYVSRLVGAGLTRQVAPPPSLECVKWCSELRPSLETMPDALVLSWSEGKLRQELKLRSTPAVEAMLAFLMTSTVSCAHQVPGNDHFEKISMFYVLVRRKLLCASN